MGTSKTLPLDPNGNEKEITAQSASAYQWALQAYHTHSDIVTCTSLTLFLGTATHFDVNDGTRLNHRALVAIGMSSRTFPTSIQLG